MNSLLLVSINTSGQMISVTGQAQPILDFESVQDDLQEEFGMQVSSTHLQKKYVCIDHRFAKMTLDVGHGLAFNLNTIPHPNSTHDFVEGRLTT